jgi:hypothetical protein
MMRSGHFLEAADELHVVVEVLSLEAGMLSASVVSGQVALLLDASGEETAAERRVGDVGDPELATGRQCLLGRVPIQQRVLALHRAQRMDGVGAPDGCRRRLREAKVAYLSPVDEPRHGPHRILDRNLGVYPVLVVDVDRVDPEALEARIACASDILGPPIHQVALAIRTLHLTELGGEHHLVAPPLERSSKQLLIVAPPVHVRRVDEVHPQVQSLMDDGDRLDIVALAVGAGHGHAPEPDGRDGQIAIPKLAVMHRWSPLVLNSWAPPRGARQRPILAETASRSYRAFRGAARPFTAP